MKPWEPVAHFVGEVLYIGGLMLLIAGVFVFAILGWTAAREFLGELVDKPKKRAITT
jgi:hypothetical protein